MLAPRTGVRRARDGSERARSSHVAGYDNPWVDRRRSSSRSTTSTRITHARVTAGANVILARRRRPGIGARIYTAEDLEGHRWMFGQPV